MLRAVAHNNRGDAYLAQGNTDAAINAPYVDYVVRGQGEATLLELLERLPDAGAPSTVARQVGKSRWSMATQPPSGAETPRSIRSRAMASRSR